MSDFGLKIWGGGLTIRPYRLGINDCMVWDCESGPLVDVSRD